MAKAKPIDEKTIDSPAMWLKASTRTRHTGNFLNTTREKVVQWEGEKAKAVFIQLDYGKIDASTAVQALYTIVMVGKLDRSLQRTAESEARKNWIVSIIGDPTPVNPQVVVLRQAFETETEARGFLCRYLTNHGASSWFGVIEAQNEKTRIQITRNEAMGMLLNPYKHHTATVNVVKCAAKNVRKRMGGQYNRPQYFSRG